MRTQMDLAPQLAANLLKLDTDHMTIAFRRRRSWGTVAFLSVWLLMWTGAGLSAISGLSRATGGEAAFLFVWLCGWALGESAALGFVAWQLRGRESLRVTPNDLEVRQQLGRLCRTRRYDAALVRDVTAARAPHGDEKPRNDFCLRVSYGDDTVHIGQGMSQREAEDVASAVLARIGGRRGWWRDDDDEPRPEAGTAADGPGTTHVYGRKESEHGFFVRLLLAGAHLVGFAVVVGGPVAWIVWALHQGPADVAVAVVVSLLVWGTGHRNHYYRTCREIRLSDDRRCELHALRRVVHLDAGQITSVRDGTGDEDAAYHYLILYEGGKMKLYGDWPDFDDFVARLEKMNPYVDLSGCRPRPALSRDEAARLHRMLERRSRGDDLREMLELARHEARHGESTWPEGRR